jgi:hypothetical protein
MKTAGKRLIERIAHTPMAWFTDGLCGRLGHFFGQIYGHARWVRENVERDSTLASIVDDLFLTLTVAGGPFQGLHYPHRRSVGSALLPKLLGTSRNCMPHLSSCSHKNTKPSWISAAQKATMRSGWA